MIDTTEKIQFTHSEIFLREDGIVEILIKESSFIGRDECVEVVDSYKEILEPKKYPLLHIIEDYVTIDKEAREFAASKEGLMFSKVEAFVINSLAHKILANFYIKVNRPSVPTRFFRSKEEAEEWLSKYL